MNFEKNPCKQTRQTKLHASVKIEAYDSKSNRHSLMIFICWYSMLVRFVEQSPHFHLDFRILRKETVLSFGSYPTPRLSVPASPQKECATLRVANVTHAWEDGKLLFFDDSFEHEVFNHCDQERVVFSWSLPILIWELETKP